MSKPEGTVQGACSTFNTKARRIRDGPAGHGVLVVQRCEPAADATFALSFNHMYALCASISGSLGSCMQRYTKRTTSFSREFLRKARRFSLLNAAVARNKGGSCRNKRVNLKSYLAFASESASSKSSSCLPASVSASWCLALHESRLRCVRFSAAARRPRAQPPSP
jgi:hypothetical protein